MHVPKFCELSHVALSLFFLMKTKRQLNLFYGSNKNFQVNKQSMHAEN